LSRPALVALDTAHRRLLAEGRHLLLGHGGRDERCPRRTRGHRVRRSLPV